MKRIFYTLTFLLLITTGSFAQDESGGKVLERMQEYLQKRLSLSKNEAERFSPVFLNYYQDLKRTNQDFKGDPLIRQQKIADLRLRYRNEFKNIMGEKRSNDIFLYERDFVDEVKKIRQERLQDQKGNNHPK